MAPTLATACAALPPEGAGLAWGDPARRPMAPTLPHCVWSLDVPPRDAAALRPVRACAGRPGAAGLSPEGAAFRLGAARRRNMAPALRRHYGFTLIELLVAIAILAVMAVLSWRGLEDMTRAVAQTRQRSDQLLTLQAGLDQWSDDLNALLQQPQISALDWNGNVLRLTRVAPNPADGMLVVAWTRRVVNGTGQWLRWQSAPLLTRGDLDAAWNEAALWGQNPSEADQQREAAITPLADWQ